MKKSLIAAAAFAVISLGAMGSANAGITAGLNGISAHADSAVAEKVQYRGDRHRHYGKRHYNKRHYKRHGHNKKWVCRYRHGHRHCAWR